MQSLSVVLAVAALTGKPVKVFAAGKSYELPLKPPPVHVEPPHPLEVVSQQLLEREAETRATVEAVASIVARTDERASALEGLIKESINGQQRIVATLMLPVVPTKYDAAGRLVEARRKDKTE